MSASLPPSPQSAAAQPALAARVTRLRCNSVEHSRCGGEAARQRGESANPLAASKRCCQWFVLGARHLPSLSGRFRGAAGLRPALRRDAFSSSSVGTSSACAAATAGESWRRVCFAGAGAREAHAPSLALPP